MKIQVRLTGVTELNSKHPGQTQQTHVVRAQTVISAGLAAISQRLTEIHSLLLHVWAIITPRNEDDHDEPAIPR